MAINRRKRKRPLRFQMVLEFHSPQNSSFMRLRMKCEMDGFGYMYWTGPDPRPWNDAEDEDEDQPGYEETLGLKIWRRGCVKQCFYRQWWAKCKPCEA